MKKKNKETFLKFMWDNIIVKHEYECINKYYG